MRKTDRNKSRGNKNVVASSPARAPQQPATDPPSKTAQNEPANTLQSNDSGTAVKVRFIPDSCSGVAMSEAILDSIAHGAFTVNKDWEITSFNRAAENITGFSRNEAIGMKCYNVFRANICKSDCALKKSIETGRDLSCQKITIKDIDGDDVQILVTTSVLRNGQLQTIGGVEMFRDISTSQSRIEQISQKYCFQNIISKNEKIQKILSSLPNIAKSESTVLLEGPSGSGKELFAKAIHNLTARKGEFIALNCAALPDTLLESELFGYKKGAFTGATKDKLGRFALAENGTLFLDEIGDISPALQLKLLRVLQEMEYEPLGSTATVKANVRVIAATNKNLKEQMEKGAFRQDLFFRLNVIKISLPPLSERKEDIPLLICYFINKFNKLKNRNIDSVSPRVLNLLMRHDFPGNIREVENIIEHCFALSQDNIIDIDSLPEGFAEKTLEKPPVTPVVDGTPLSDAEASAIMEALDKFNGNRKKTAMYLGIEKTTLWRKMKKYNLIYPPEKAPNNTPPSETVNSD